MLFHDWQSNMIVVINHNDGSSNMVKLLMDTLQKWVVYSPSF